MKHPAGPGFSPPSGLGDPSLSSAAVPALHWRLTSCISDFSMKKWPAKGTPIVMKQHRNILTTHPSNLVMFSILLINIIWALVCGMWGAGEGKKIKIKHNQLCKGHFSCQSCPHRSLGLLHEGPLPPHGSSSRHFLPATADPPQPPAK